jgi:hypothetical protein
VNDIKRLIAQERRSAGRYTLLLLFDWRASRAERALACAARLPHGTTRTMEEPAMSRDERLDQALALRIAREPYFAEEWRAARNLLRSAIYGADLLRWGGRVVTGRCGCAGRCQCLHEMAFQLYTGK